MKWSRIVLAAAAGLTLSVAASAALVDAGDQDVRFLATGPGGMKIKGTASDLKASESDGKIKLVVPANSLKTGIGKRDAHTLEALETDNYKDITLVVPRSKLKFPEDGASKSGVATGSFTMHGVTKPLKFTYRAKRTGSDYHVQALAQIDIRDYKVEPPCLLGVCVDPEVKLKVAFKLRDE